MPQLNYKKTLRQPECTTTSRTNFNHNSLHRTVTTQRFDLTVDEPEPGVEPSAPPTSPTSPMVPSTSGVPQLDSITASYYLPAGPEDFRAHRLRHAQQETMSYGPLRGRRYALGPYANPTSSPSPTTSTTEEHAAFREAFELELSWIRTSFQLDGLIDEETGYMSFPR